MKKKLCVLQVTPEEPNPNHVQYFNDKESCDFYFVTHDSPHKDAMEFCPNTTWVDTRNILAQNVPKEYEYYAFVDYDYVFRPQRSLGALEQILEDLEEYKPAVLTYYPGNGLITPFAKNTSYRDSKSASILPFSHCGMKIIHHSLLNWFFPMITKFGGGVEACHLFNILEIPFLKNVVCSHKMLYDNGFTDENAPHNRDGFVNKFIMDLMWDWIKPSFKKNKLLNFYCKNEQHLKDSLLIKEAFVSLALNNKLQISKNEIVKDYFDIEKIKNFFDLSHEHFKDIR